MDLAKVHRIGMAKSVLDVREVLHPINKVGAVTTMRPKTRLPLVGSLVIAYVFEKLENPFGLVYYQIIAQHRGIVETIDTGIVTIRQFDDTTRDLISNRRMLINYKTL